MIDLGLLLLKMQHYRVDILNQTGLKKFYPNPIDGALRDLTMDKIVR